MNKENYILLIIIILSIFSCDNTTNNKSIDKKKIKNIEVKTVIETKKNTDSINLDKLMKSALKLANDNIEAKYFSKKYSQTVGKVYDLTTEIIIGNFFSKDKKHLLIRRKGGGITYIDIYKKTNDKFELIKKDKHLTITHISDTIFDVNNDGFKDFLLHWYPSSGCCLANNYDVSIYDTKTGEFKIEYSFINPTFYPNEKLIRGFDYGQPNEVNLYKYKWKNNKIDTIEYVCPYEGSRGKYIKTKKPLVRATSKDGIVLKKIPFEYRKIKDFNWVDGSVMNNGNKK